MNRIMIDIETLGTKPGCVVLAIGAVRIDACGAGRLEGRDDGRPAPRHTFFATLDPEPQMSRGMATDWSTLRWWTEQPEGLRDIVWNGCENPQVAIQRLRDWSRIALGGGWEPPSEVWAKSPAFDLAILDALCDNWDEPPIFPEFRCHRDVRTWIEAPGWTLPELGAGLTPHHPLDDAIHQARQVLWADRKMAWMREQLGRLEGLGK